MSVLLIAEHNNKEVKPFTYNAITAASQIDENLDILSETKIGDFPPTQLYSTESNDGKIYFGLTNYVDINMVKVYDSNNNEIASYDVGIIPGDFAFWKGE